MKKSRILLASGALALAVVGMLGAKANKKFSLTSGTIEFDAQTAGTIGLPANTFTKTSNTHPVYARMYYTTSGVTTVLYTSQLKTTGGVNRVYFF